MKTKGQIKKGVMLSLGISLFLIILFSFGFFSNIQTNLSDGLYGGIDASDEIIIVKIDDKSLQTIGRWPWDRSEYVPVFEVLKESSVVGVDIAFFEDSDDDLELIESVEEVGNIVMPVEYTLYVKSIDGVKGKDQLLPIIGLRENVGLGYINIISDKDGVSRSVNLDVGGEYNSFAEVIYEQHTGEEFKNQESRFLINYIGEPGSFKSYSFSDVASISSSEFEDKIVLVGVTAANLHDDAFVPTSAGKAMPGVEIHANTIQTMLEGNLLKQESYLMVVLSILVSSLLVVYLIKKFNTFMSFVISIGLILGYIFLVIKVFETGTIMNLVYVPLSIILTNGGVVTYYYIIEKNEKKKVISAFGKYVSPKVVNEIMVNPSKLKLGGESKTLTVLFSDIRGFTSVSEKLSPEELVKHLNEYLTSMTDIIVDDYNGLVDKYMGDAIMAFWGAPLDDEKQTHLACSASIEMMKSLELLREKWKKEGKPELHIGIGLSVGKCVVGNMGSKKRFDYTAMGDSINIGSRLEGLTKEYGVPIIISGDTAEKVKEEFLVRELDYVVVKGKKEPIKIFELICKKNEATEEQTKKKECFEKGFKKYLNQEWSEAIELFKECGDFASEVFVKRCEKYKVDSPGVDWNKVWVMKTK